MNTHNYGLYSKKINLNLNDIKNSSIEISEAMALHCDTDSNFDFGGIAPASTKLFEQYNCLMYPLPGMHQLYQSIQSFLHDCMSETYGKKLNINYYIQSWINIYDKGKYIEWHDHAKDTAYCWHGFFCVNVEPSKTSYQTLGSSELFDIESENNLIVLGLSNHYKHRTWPWEKEEPRITIAFDIVPENLIRKLNGNSSLKDSLRKYPYYKNHWIPI